MLAEFDDPNYTELLSYADLDALVELHGHIRAENPAMDVFFKTAPNVVPDDLYWPYHIARRHFLERCHQTAV